MITLAEPIDEFVEYTQRYATGTKNAVGMGIMLDCGAATTKPGPAYMARGFHSISSSVSMSSLPVLLLSPSSSSLACGGQHFLCTSQRSADDARLIGDMLLLLAAEGMAEDDDEEAGIAAFLCASHLSAESARPGLSGGGDVLAFLRGSEISDGDARAAPLLMVATGQQRRTTP
jgi:hypothetical protein